MSTDCEPGSNTSTSFPARSASVPLKPAEEQLRKGLGLAESGGTTSLASRALAELAAAGARTRPHTRTGAASLTPTERCVVENERRR
jgi:hypothetical protein